MAKKKTTSPRKKTVHRKKKQPWFRTSAAIAVFSVALVLLIALVVLLGYNALKKGVDSDVLVTVNGDPILVQEVRDSYLRLPEELREAYPLELVVDQTIDKMLVIQHAKSQGVEVSEEEVASTIALQSSMFGASEVELRELLAAQGVSWEEFERSIYEDLLLGRFVEEVLFPSITVSPVEAQEYYDSNLADYVALEGEVRVRHILVESEEEAYSLLAEVLDGSNFARLAMTHSLDSASAVDGGALGLISADSPLVPEFKEAALALEVGEVSDPVETQFGWHLILRDEAVVDFLDAREDIVELLTDRKAREEFTALLERLRDEADIEYYQDLSVVLA